jgi:dTDP-glucose 4,6-dehydratase
MENVLVIGGSGFVGSNFIHYLLADQAAVQVTNYDAMTYMGNWHNLADVAADSRYQYIEGDLSEIEKLEDLILAQHFDAIVNFATELHVAPNPAHPGAFLDTNVKGVLNVLDILRSAPDTRFVQLSTDKVYGSRERDYFTEEDRLRPNAPYAASKGAADLLIRSYVHAYGLNAVVVRSANQYGPYQFPDHFIPKMITNNLLQIKLPVYGDGLNVRDWLYVGDAVKAIAIIMEQGVAGETYNIGGHNEITDLEVVRLITKQMKAPDRLIEHVPKPELSDQRYALSTSKVERELDWRPETSFKVGVQQTIKWYEQNDDWWLPLKED